MRFYCDLKRHLVCWPYSVNNLHQMAAELGISRDWYHGGDKPHYDIPKRRVHEIMPKCTIIRPREILAIIQTQTEPVISLVP
jgi:hypothetical protein